jgi:hypothetical protein
MQNVSPSDRPDYVAIYEQVVEKASRVKSLLKSRHIRLKSASDLDQLMKKAEVLSSEWKLGERNPGWQERLFSGLHVNRIRSAVLGVGGDHGAQEAFTSSRPAGRCLSACCVDGPAASMRQRSYSARSASRCWRAQWAPGATATWRL